MLKIYSAFIFLIILACYIFTSPPVITTGDSGEFMTGAYTLGISHPPGFPLYSLITKTFTSLPLSNPGWRMEFGSMFFASLTVVLLFIIIYILNGSILAAALSSLCYGLAPAVWSQSIISEVYSLNAFFTALCILALILWKKNYKSKYLYLFSLIYAISLSNHYPLMLLALPSYIALIILSPWWERTKVRGIFLPFILFIIGLSIYIYLPIRSLSNPPIDWGNPENYKNFISTIFRKQYTSVELTQNIAFAEKLWFVKSYFAGLIKQFGILLIPAIAGAWIMFKKQRDYFYATLLLFLLNTIFLIYTLHFSYTPERLSIIEVYYLPSYIACAIWIGLGISTICHPESSEGSRFLLFALLPLACIYNFSNGLKINYQRNNFIAYDYVRNILSTPEPASTLFINQAGDESLFPVLFLQKVLGKRKDLSIYDCYGNVFKNIYGDDFTLMDNKNEWQNRRRSVEEPIIRSSKAPVYYLTFSPEESGVNFPLIRSGLLYRVSNAPDFPSLVKEGIEGSLPGPKNSPLPLFVKEGRESKHNFQLQLYNMRGLGNINLNDYQEREIAGVYDFIAGNTKGTIEESTPYFDRAITRAHDINWILNNIGLMYYHNGLYEKAKKTFLSLLNQYPDYFSGWYNLGLVNKAMGNIDDAIYSFTKSSKLNPYDKDIYRELASLYWDKGMNSEASKIYTTALQGDLETAEHHLYSGAAFYKKGILQKAIDEWKKAILVKPDYALAWYNLGITLYELKRFEDARDAFEKFIKHDPANPLCGKLRKYYFNK